MFYGPFSRRESPSQTRETAVLQVQSGEIWGAAPRGYIQSSFLIVKAYRGQLAQTNSVRDRGIEFTTSTKPFPCGSPFEARWYYPETPGVFLRKNTEGDEFAAIQANVTNYQP
jgi:hypothetical protein